MKAIILAGGGGTRLWPISRKRTPKQTAPVVGADTMLRATFDRLRARFSPNDVIVATSESQGETVRAMLPEIPAANIVLEPCRRDTAAAIGHAVARIAHVDPSETFVVINSDAHVRDDDGYLRAIAAAEEAVSRDPDHPVLICMTPTYPETGYGYVKTGPELDRIERDGETHAVHAVDRFVEKPDLATAADYVADGSYLWNATLIVARAGEFMTLFARHLPDHAVLFARMREAFGTDREDEEVRACFARLPSISIDYGILEKAELRVMPAEFGWTDIGNWRTVHDILARGEQKTVSKGAHVDVDSDNCFVISSSGRLVATAGLKDMIVVDTGDAVLVCPRDRAQDVKRIVAELERDADYAEYL